MRIVFMGTPAFAVPSLKILFDNGYTIPAVITAPDKPAGRGMKLTASPVKQYALEHGIPVLQPERLKNPEFVAHLKSLQADLQVVVAFRMLPEVVWNMPPLGTLNLHGSLLPKYRGAAPINWAIINGETETGVTTFLLKHEIDTGDILLQQRIPIGPDDTAGDLHDRMMNIGADTIFATVRQLAAQDVTPIPQSSLIPATNAPKIFTDTCRLDLGKTVHEAYNFVRGLSPYPGAWVDLNGKVLKIFKAKPVVFDMPHASSDQIKLYQTDQKTYLKIFLCDGWLELLEIQIEGKRRMSIVDFLNGNKV
jgi:methionyl-tRNA formyltransferase